MCVQEIGNLAIDMCCSCGVFVLGTQPAVACEHCVDVYHLDCMGLKAIPDGEWVCPGCILASGATGKAAQVAAAMGRSKGGSAARAARDANRKRATPPALPPPAGRTMSFGPRESTGAPRAAPQGFPGAAATGAGSSTGQQQQRAVRGPPTLPGLAQRSNSTTSAAMLPPGMIPPPVLALPTGVIFKTDEDFSSSDEDAGAISDGDVGSGPAHKRQRTGGGGGGSGGSGKRAPPQRSRYGIFRVDPADAALYATNCPGMPNPNADGRSLVLRIATVLLSRQVAPNSKRWRAQVMLNCNMVAGIHCEYHKDVSGTHTHTHSPTHKCISPPPVYEHKYALKLCGKHAHEP